MEVLSNDGLWILHILGSIAIAIFSTYLYVLHATIKVKSVDYKRDIKAKYLIQFATCIYGISITIISIIILTILNL